MAAVDLRAFIRDIPDFPTPGVTFKDISPLLLDARALDASISGLAELARYGVGGRNLRVFRSSADREAQLLQSILAPALRSRNPDRRKEAVEALENLASVTTHLKHLLLIRDLRKIAT